MARPIIFLDIDGVLCTQRSCVAQRGLMQTLDPVGIKMLELLIQDFKAQIVLSSTWRLHHDQVSMTAILQNAGMKEVPWHQNWKTDNLYVKPRGEEIKKWLVEQGGPNPKYLILDDQSDFLEEQKPYYVETSFDVGITYHNYQQARKILNG